MESKKNMSFAGKVYNNCTAYNKYLKRKGIAKISQLPKKFHQLPLISKKDYVEKYPIEERLYKDKSLSDYYMICTSSGSTGKPTIWPRDYQLDNKAIEFNANMYEKLFGVSKKKTLVVVTFGLGAWTAGMLTARLCWECSKKGYKLSVVTPGLDKEIAFRVINELGRYYDQTIITGYPPFIVDMVKYGHKRNFNFKKINAKVHYTSAGLLESQRNELVKVISNNKSRSDVLGFYASSEAGIIGIETSETIKILDMASKDEEFSKALFNKVIPPTFVMYDKKRIFAENYKDRVIVTVDQPVPLVRYDTKDRGGVLAGKYLSRVCKKYGYSCPKGLENGSFIYVYGREDSVRLLSNIYIEDIQYCIKESKIHKKLTGKFKFGLGSGKLKNVLKIIVFLNEGESVTVGEQEIFIDELYKNLIKINPDFKMVSKGIRFSIDIKFLSESNIKYEGGKFSYFL